MPWDWAHGRGDHTTKTTNDNLTIIATTAKAKCTYILELFQVPFDKLFLEHQ